MTDPNFGADRSPQEELTEADQSAAPSPLPESKPSYAEHQAELQQQPGSFSDRVLFRVGNELWRTPPGPLPAGSNVTIEWSVPAGLLLWLSSICLLVLTQAIGVIIIALYYSSAGKKITTSIAASDPGVLLAGVLSTLPAHILTLVVCWAVVTRMGKQPFLESLGWTWHRNFGPLHAVGFAVGAFLITALLPLVLPNAETPLDQVLRTSLPIRLSTAFLAVVTAPIVEEVVYRGVLFAPLARRFGKVAAVFTVALLFTGVHVQQYLGGWAVIVGITALSFGLTIVRAYTNSLLPCFAIHTIFNAIVSILIVFGRGMS